MSFRGPLADSYASAVALVPLALTPYLVLSTALTPLEDVVGKDLHLGTSALQLTAGMANAAYAFGAVGAVQLTQRLPVRRTLLVFATLLAIGSVLAAWAPTPGFFVAGHIAQGAMTGAMLISAVPPLVIGYPVDKLPITAVTMNLGLFGAVAAGPVVGGIAAGAQSWRPLMWIVAGLGVAALAFALLTYEDQQPQDREAPVDAVALSLAGVGCAAAFFGVSSLQGHHLLSLPVLLPGAVGVLMIVALLAYEYRTPNPLMPVERLATTWPVAQILIAMCAGAAAVALVDLAEVALKGRGVSPGHAAALFWPELGAALAAAGVFGALFRTRYVPLLPFAGLLVLAGGGVILTGAATGGDVLVLVGAGLVGLGEGASVSPALFVSGWSLPSPTLPRVFALVELLRAVAAFLVAPLLVHLAQTAGDSPRTGLTIATWAGVGIALGGAIVAGAIVLAARPPLRRPELGPWLEGERPAIDSPPLFAGTLYRDA